MPMYYYLRHLAEHWFWTRRRIDLLAAIPALSAMMLVLASGLGMLGNSIADKQAQYRHATLEAVDAGRCADAELFWRKLQLLGGTDAEVTYRVAVLTESARGASATWDRLAKLAPLDVAGYGPAHSWLAEAIITKKVALSAADPDAVAEKHLLHAVTAQPDQSKPKQDLALHYVRLRRWEQAAAILAALVDEDPDMRLLRAQALAKSGRMDEAQREARQFCRAYRRLMKSGASFQPEHFVRWAAARQMLGDLDNAAAVLQLGRQRHPSSEELGKALARVHLLRANKVGGSGTRRLARQLEMLEEALDANPRDVAVLGRIAELSQARGADAVGAKPALQEVLASGSAPALVHTILGTMAAASGHERRARLHLEQACRQDESAVVALNNLAWVLLQSKEPDLDKALQLAEQAVAANPDVPEFRETRGQVLVRLGRWHEAIADLEFALGKLRPSPSLHKALARAYGEVGDVSMSKRHERAATEDSVWDDSI